MTTTTARPTLVGVHGVAKRYGPVQALAGVDLSVSRGETVAILGPNGAGKTTLIEIMLGLRTADTGTVTLFGGPPGRNGIPERVGAMLQDTDVPELLTVAEIVHLVRRYYPWSLPTAEILHRADLTDKAGVRATKLSGGQRQRLSFAMAIAGDPDLLFLDEPTAALDVHARRAFWDQMRSFAGLGKTILLSSHNLDEVAALADRVVVIREGRVLADDTPDRIAATFAASEVGLRTDAPSEWLRSLPGMVDVRSSGDVVTLATTEPEADLAALFAAGHRVAGLTVARADLESAFVALTDNHDRSAA
ncbi:ABC transporter ATP-binding protein [Mobilicoccus sp.]|uniref:ABC transporter ATP-binding protein n=1 Tax=Mobilicoccus sp. TaxID=2034349 RepID=UPI00289852B5|nr:ABC transporter ATP-binding protein [Mobilicoccus sp.]